MFCLSTLGSLAGISITGITLRSTEVRPGDLYVGLRGAKSHGALYADAAKAAGAVAILTDADGVAFARESGLPIIVAADPRELLGEMSAWIYGTENSAPRAFGVTGTNGKTSVTYMIEALLRHLGVNTGLSSTAERHIGEQSIVSRLTTPEATELHALLALMREDGVEAAAIEVSAQAIAHDRIGGIRFDVVGFSNLSHDHLDEFVDMERYLAVKATLFVPERARTGVVSLDTHYGDEIVALSQIPVTTISSIVGAGAEWAVQTLEEQSTFTTFTLTGPDGQSLTTRIPLIGAHMVANAGLAIVMLVQAGYSLRSINASLGVTGIEVTIPGRTERVSGANSPALYVDFGHSPDAFQNTLAAVRQFTTGRIIMVCGADGDRDRTKRFDMGRVASEYADVFVVTDAHPRFEDPDLIRASLIAGAASAVHPAELVEVIRPEKAIRHAVAIAEADDSILWSGLGHQDYRDILGVRTPFDVRDEARQALREYGWL
jgi:UDP-N-acetylmuramoyl-L-alanyl-D-glutamate--2,6-diaminopimelate ligase